MNNPPSQKGTGTYDYYYHTHTTREVEDARLALQALVGLEAEWPVLKRLSLENRAIHCIGAGPCFYENELFRRVQPRVALASDIDEESIRIARACNGNAAISFAVLDATAPQPPGFDVLVERFLLIQVSDSTARSIVRRMVDSLPSGGRAILIEYVNSICIPQPMCAALLKLRGVMMERFKAHGADPDIGRRLEEFLEDAGMHAVTGHDISYEMRGTFFNQQIEIATHSFGTPAEIIGNSYAQRYQRDYPQLVRELLEWLNDARQPGTQHSLKHTYRLAIGTKL